jgi:hypothetical protein
MKHTPGPWHIAETEDNSFGRVTFRQICATSKNGAPFQLCLNSVHERPQEAKEREANARLIAAAPDMLSALKIASCEVESRAGRFAWAQILVKTLEAAIEAAEGRE